MIYVKLKMKKVEWTLLTLFMIMGYFGQVKAADRRGCRGIMDVVIVIDGSDSINAAEYQLIRETMEKFVDSLDIREDEIRLAFVVYSSHIPLQTPLSGNKTFLLQTARNLPHPRDGTKTSLAIERMRWILGNATRPNNVSAPTLGIVFTDGISKNPPKTAEEASLLRDMGTKVYSVGISFKINDDELLDIAGEPSRVIKIRTFVELKKRLNSFVTLVCPKCPIPSQIKNAVVPLSEFIVETSITYFCRPKYVPIGRPVITCQLNQTWTDTDFACKADCGAPSDEERSTVSYDETIEGSRASYTCDQNTVTEGNTSRICQEDFNWSPVNFYCRPDCGPPNVIERSTISDGSNLEGSTRIYTCDANTAREGETFITCQKNGQWTPTDLYCRPDCGTPLDIARATISVGNNLEGTTRIYTCAERTVTEGETSIVCQNNGQWSGTNLYCRPDCGVPMDIPRARLVPGQTLEGVLIGGGTLEGDRRQYECLQNTVMEGDPNIICRADGTWSPTNLYCRPDCGPPPTFQYATYNRGSTLEGSTITYTCNTNTVLEGKYQTKCLISGNWSDINLFCRPDCGIPMNVDRAIIKPGLTTYQAVREYVCAVGTVMEGNPYIECQDNFEWTPTNLYCRPDCGPPPIIQYATYSSATQDTLEGAVVTYTCGENTVMEGNPETKCLVNGSWSSFFLFCRPDCGIPMNIDRASLKPGLTTFETTREYVCALGTVMEGDPYITCGADFRWSGTDLYCRPDCGPVPEVKHATFVSSGTTLEGDNVVYTCGPNTVTEGTAETTCLKTGWSAFNLYCRPDCGIPMNIDRAKILPGLTTYGTTREYVCDAGTVMEGSPMTTCLENFRWSTPNLYCRPDCGPAPNIRYATYTSTQGTLEGSVITYTCSVNTQMEGDSKTKCLISGNYSAFDLYCRPNCGIPKEIARAVLKPGGTLYGDIREYNCAHGTVMEGDPFITCQEDFKWSMTNLYCRPDCGPPRSIQYASYTSNGTTLEGDLVTYQCNANTSAEGTAKSKCLISGEWSAFDLYCRPDCGIPMDIPRATIRPGKTTYGTTREYVCASGTVMQGNPFIECRENFQWSTTDLYCRPDCGAPPSVQYATYFSTGSTLEGDTVTYTCATNTVPEGTANTTCLKSGYWSKFDVYCRPNCGIPMDIERAYLKPGPTTYEATREYVCASGTVMEGNPIIRCMDDFRWSLTNLYCRPDCGPAPVVRYANYTSTRSTLEGDVVTYTCARNTVMEGLAQTSCLNNGSWSRFDLYCRPNCGIPMDIERAIMEPGSTTYGSNRTYICASGTVMEGNPTITCQENFQWSSTNLYCRPDCGVPPNVMHATYTSTGTTLEGDVITYTCAYNTVSEGKSNTTCLVTGQWSAFDLYCRPDCGIPMDILRANVKPGLTTYGAQREYVCASGTVMQGSPVITCQKDFKWSESDLYCRPDCGTPPTIQYATFVSSGTTLEDDVITYTCADNTVAEGFAKTKCLDTGYWSRFNLYCRPNCGIPMDIERATVKPGPTTYETTREYVCALGTVMEGNPLITCMDDFRWSETNLYCRPDCGPAPNVRYANYTSTGSTLEGDVVTYTCGDHTVMEGLARTTCLVNGSWSMFNLYCRPDCGIPMNIERAEIDLGPTTYGTTRKYTCAEGTVMEGEPKIFCQENFLWSSTNLYCRPNCGAPPDILYASYLSTGTTLEGDSITYTCSDNTVAEGLANTICLISGKWSAFDLYCRPNCGIPKDIQRATIKPGLTTFGTTREYVCNSGSVMEGNPFITCRDDFLWTLTNLYCRPNCGKPPKIRYASYTALRTLEGDVATYSCGDNTVIEGDHESTCLKNGSWSYINIYCRPNCGMPMDIKRATLRPGLTTYGASREYVCDAGTVMEGDPKITCQENFLWTTTNLYCRPNCGPPPTTRYSTYVSTRSTLEGDVITYTCSADTVAEGNAQVKCLETGSWSDFDFYCRPNCGIPMEKERATIKPGPTTYEAEREYVCASGTVMEGNPFIRCREDFTWSPTDLYCRPDCGPPPDVRYANYTSTGSTLEDDEVIYTCAMDTVKEGLAKTTCLVDGSWSVFDLYCRPDCGIPKNIERAVLGPGPTTYGSTRIYTCASGTVMEGNPSIVCQENFEWTSTDLYCRPDCGMPREILRSTYLSTRSTLEGDTVTYTCAANTVSEGISKTTCMVNGQWSAFDLYCRPDCGPAPIVRHADYTSTGSTLEGDVVTYVCADHTVLEGSYETTCLVNGSWSWFNLYCRPDCGIPMNKDRATIDVGQTTYGTLRTYTCAEGTVMEGDPTITCQENFLWSSTNLYCRPDCGAPPNILYATYLSARGTTLEGEIIKYTCADNTVAEGVDNTTCLVTGKWSEFNLYCRPNCGIPMDIERATLKPGPTTYGTTREYVCNSGSVVEGNPFITCRDDFEWTRTNLYCRPDCGKPRRIQYASYTAPRTLEGDVATYSCGDNTVIEGYHQSTCLKNGSWSYIDIYCRPNCGMPMDIDRATLKPGLTTYGTIREYICDEGTVMEGNPTTVCQENFNWTTTDLYCRPDCGIPPVIRYATHSGGRTLENDVISYTCQSNTVAEGIAETTCLNNGSWSYFNLYCRPDCGVPMDIDRAVVSDGPTTYGSSRNYICYMGTVMEGNPKITCQEDFTWSKTDVYCRPDCGNPTSVMYTSYSSTGTTLEGDTVVYKCNENTVREGIYETTCLKNASWSYFNVYCRPNCGIPMDKPRAVLKPGDTTYGTIREYMCASGTVMEGDPKIVCQEDFTWSATNLYCRPNCGQPPQVRHATYFDSSTLEGDSVQYNCLEGTVAEGTSITSCLKNGTWSYFDLYCRPSCGNPPSVRYAFYDEESRTLEDDVITYSCMDETVLEGMYQTTCLKNGSWSYFDIYCRPNCGIPMEKDRATIKPGLTTYGEFREYVCNEGTVMQGNPIIQCQEDFKWSSSDLYCRPICGDPPLVKYASFSSTGTMLEGDSLFYTCDANTVQEGEYKTTCQEDGTWSSFNIYCRPDCGIPMDIPRATLKPGQTTYGTIREYICASGTVMEGNPNIVCHENFTWSSSDIYCRPDCGRPPLIPNALSLGARTLEGDIVQFTCALGTVAEGISTTTCQSNGTWSTIDLYCRPDCGDPPMIRYASYEEGPTLEGDVITYSCGDGTVLEGIHETTCLKNGSWSYFNIYCRPNCGMPTKIKRAKIRPGLTTYGSIREYVCNEGTVMEGNPNIVCQENFTWSSSDLYCRPNCGQPPSVARSTYSNVGSLEGDTVEYACIGNTVLEGQAYTKCLSNGSWSYFDLYCRPDCGIPTDVYGALLKPGLTTYGAVREYVCLEGSRMEGDPEIVCGENFMWSRAQFYCRPGCGRPPDIPNATYNLTDTYEGSTVKYTCNGNTVVQGICQTTCLKNGSWSYMNLYCRPNCGPPPTIKRAHYTPGPTLEGDVIEYSCDSPGISSGVNKTKCLSDGSWSYIDLYCKVDCGDPPKVPYAQVHPGPGQDGNSLFYVCDDTYIQEGDGEIICLENGTWSKINVFCRSQCGKPMLPRFARLDMYPGPLIGGTKLRLACSSGSVPNYGDPTITCQDDGTWSKPELKCTPDCGLPMVIPHARLAVLPTSTLEGSKLSYICDDGSVPSGTTESVCTADGTWSPVDFICKPDCGAPPMIPRTTVTYEKDGAVVRYTCDYGFWAKGQKTIVCQSDGTWSSTDLRCIADCGPPQSIPRATITVISTLEGSYATYECNPYSVPHGNGTIFCGSDGAWTRPFFFCKVDCGVPPKVSHAQPHQGSNKEGNSLFYVCDDTYIQEGDGEIICLENGTWSKINVFCRSQCPKPMLPRFARLDMYPGPLIGGTKLRLACSSGSVPNYGDPTITCQDDGTWSKPELKCTPDCGLPMALPFGRLVAPPASTLEGSELRYVCDDGSVPTGTSTSVCTADGTWSPVNFFCKPDCGDPPKVPHAQLHKGPNQEGDSLFYVCDDTYLQEGDAEIRCLQNGTWSKINVFCRSQCGKPKLPRFARLDMYPGPLVGGTVLRLACSSGSVPNYGDPTIICKEDGTWSKPELKCTRDCGLPMALPFGRLAAPPVSTLEGSELRYVCDDGSVPTGTFTSVCRADGTWSPINFFCKPNCGEPPEIPGATMSYENEGTVVRYTCDYGSWATIVCQSDGTWTTTNLNCRPDADCGAPPTILRATIALASTLQGSYATYTCDPYSIPDGNGTIFCGSDGVWTKPNFFCKADCGNPPTIQGAVLSPGYNTEGAKRAYSCATLNEEFGIKVIMCQHNGKWTNTNFKCIPGGTKPYKDPCDDCIIRNGIGFNPHPNDCAKFTHCVKGADNKLVATFRSCPYGQYWDQGVLTCRKSEDVHCPHDECRNYIRNHPMTNTDNCRAYWKCEKSKSIGTCCKEGEIYIPSQGCVKDIIGICSDACPPVTYEHSSCDSREITSDPKHYERYIPGQGWVRMPCPMGTHYHHSSCGCAVHVSFKNETNTVCKPELYLPFDHDYKDKSGNNLHVENHGVVLREGAAYFNGQAQLVIPRFSSFQYRDLVITMKFFEYPPTGNLVPLMSNSNFCKSNISMALIKSKQSIHFFAKCDTGKSTTFGLPMKVGDWNQVYYIHDGKTLEGSSNGIKAEKSALGKLQSTHTPIHIGFGKGRSKFKGYMDEIAIYSCRPSFL